MTPCVFNPFSIIHLASSLLEICIRGRRKLLRWLTVHLNIIKIYLIKPRQPHFFFSFLFFLSLIFSLSLSFVLIPHQISLILSLFLTRSLSLSTINLGHWIVHMGQRGELEHDARWGEIEGEVGFGEIKDEAGFGEIEVVAPWGEIETMALHFGPPSSSDVVAIFCW